MCRMRNCIYLREKSNTQKSVNTLVCKKKKKRKGKKKRKLGHWSKENTHQYLIDDVSVDNGRRDEIEGAGKKRGGGGGRKSELIKYL